MGFSYNLRNLRTKKGLSQKKLANAAGVSQTAIYHWEKGVRTPKIEQLQKIAIALDCPITDLIDEDTLNLTDDIISLFANSDALETDESNANNPLENYLICKFRELNDEGQKKSTDYIDDLTQIPEYRRENN